MAKRTRVRILFPNAIVVLFVVCLAVDHPAWSANWSDNGGVSLEFGFVQSETVGIAEVERTSTLAIEPFYSFSRVSRAQTLQGRLGVQHRRYTGDGGQSITPSASVDSNITLIDRGLWFYTQADATSQHVTSDGFTDDVLTAEDQTNTVLQLQLSPEFKYQSSDAMIFGSRAAVSRRQISSNGGTVDLDDSTSFGIEGSLLWALGRHGHLMQLKSRVQQTNFDGGTQARLSSLTFGFVAPVGSRMFAYASVGHDKVSIDARDEAAILDSSDNSQETALLRDNSGEQYALGIRWTPNRRLEFNAQYGKRAFGRQPSVSMLLTGKSSRLEFRWSRDLQIARFIDTQLQGQTLGESEDQQILDGGDTIGENFQPACVIQDSFGCEVSPVVADAGTIEESISTIYTLRGRVSTLRLSLTLAELTSLEGANAQNRNKLEASLSRSLAKNLSLTVTGSLIETRSDAENSVRSNSEVITASMVWFVR